MDDTRPPMDEICTSGAARVPTRPKMTKGVNELIGKFHSLNLSAAPVVEPAIVSPFWAPGDFVNFSGPAGCGKTRLAVDIAIAAIYPYRHAKALGGILQFDHDLLAGRNVAIIDAENDQARWESLLRQKLEREGVSTFSGQERILHIRASDLGIQVTARWSEVSRDLARAFALSRIGFVIGDTIARIWAPEEVNSPSWIQRGFGPFREECRKYGISCLMLTHTKRSSATQDPAPEGPIGSSFQEGQADGQIMISRATIGGATGIKLTLRKSRRAYWIKQDSSVTLKFTPELGYEPVGDWQRQWPHDCPNYEIDSPVLDVTTRAKIQALLEREPARQWSSQDVATGVACGERTARRQLSAMEAVGSVRRLWNGPATRWEAAK